MILQESETKVLVVYTLEPWNHALTYLRYRAPAEALGWKVVAGRDNESVSVELVKEADCILIQRVFPHWREPYQQIVEAAQRYRKPLIYEIDDLLIALPPEHPCVEWYRPVLEDILRGVMDADRVVVSSKLLKQIFSTFNADIQIWPAYLPDTIWTIPEARSCDSQVVRIGYMGGITHTPDLDSLSQTLQRILDEWGDKVEIHLWGCKPSHELDGQVFIHYLEEKIDYREFVETFSKAQADIWLAPLTDSIFNRCKSSIKYWEYAAVGGAGIFSDLEPYQAVVKNGETGYLAKNTEDWYVLLSKLISDSDIRASIAEQAQNHLMNKGRMSLNLEKWKQIYSIGQPKAKIVEHSTPFQQAFSRFAQQLIERSVENELVIHNQQKYIEQLESRNRDLDAILNSRSWRLVQWIGKLRRLGRS